MIKLTVEQALNMAGVCPSDSAMERDLKFFQWIADRKYKICAAENIGADDQIDLLIIKESCHGKQSRYHL
jgi:hypothetical protein